MNTRVRHRSNSVSLGPRYPIYLDDADRSVHTTLQFFHATLSTYLKDRIEHSFLLARESLWNGGFICLFSHQLFHLEDREDWPLLTRAVNSPQMGQRA